MLAPRRFCPTCSSVFSLSSLHVPNRYINHNRVNVSGNGSYRRAMGRSAQHLWRQMDADSRCRMSLLNIDTVNCHEIKPQPEKQAEEGAWVTGALWDAVLPSGRVHLLTQRDAFRDHVTWIPSEFSVILAWPVLEEHINLCLWFPENHSHLASNYGSHAGQRAG